MTDSKKSMTSSKKISQSSGDKRVASRVDDLIDDLLYFQDKLLRSMPKLTNEQRHEIKEQQQRLRELRAQRKLQDWEKLAGIHSSSVDVQSMSHQPGEPHGSHGSHRDVRNSHEV